MAAVSEESLSVHLTTHASALGLLDSTSILTEAQFYGPIGQK